MTPSWTAATSSSQGFKITRTVGERTRVTFEEVVIESPTEGDNGVFESPRITFTGGTVAGESNGTIGNATMTEVTVLDPAKVQGGGLSGRRCSSTPPRRPT